MGLHKAPPERYSARRFAVTAAMAGGIGLAAVGAVAFLGEDPQPQSSFTDAAVLAERSARAEAERAGRNRPAPTIAGPTPTPSASPTKKAKPAERVTSTGSCGASYYWEPQPTASGEQFDPNAMTAAHKTLPLGSRVRVTNPDNGKSVVVRINDRGPFVSGRCLDLSKASFARIGNLGAGVMDVKYEVLAKRS